jgi:hypothetical protein
MSVYVTEYPAIQEHNIEISDIERGCELSRLTVAIKITYTAI